ncbi:hypothetical protein [Dongshaea marina]|uniref:hypothetical protein n=1 Tax=Dongshaea marina TaxID=2047966 RepID=UPI000D3EC3DE|nr:hypothetical protein [Dongshaea marina]
MKSTFRRAHSQRGLTTIDLLIGFAGIIILIISIMLIAGMVRSQMGVMQATAEMGLINSAATNWKGMRPNYTGISMGNLCSSGELNDSICGTSSDGSSSNPFGGNFTVAVDTNVSNYVVTLTNVPTDKITALADKLAPTSLDQCSSATSCGSVQVSGTDLSVTYRG